MYMVVAVATAGILAGAGEGRAPSPARVRICIPGTAAPVHPVHPAALAEEQLGCACPAVTTTSCSHGALQPLARTGASPAGSWGPQGENTLMGGRVGPQVPQSLFVPQQQKAGCSWEMGGDGDAQCAQDPPTAGAPKPRTTQPTSQQASSSFLADPIKLGGKRGFTCMEPMDPPFLPGALVSAAGLGLQGVGLLWVELCH